MTKIVLEVVGKTDAGCVRSNNEDSLAMDKEIGLLVIADGMGGHNSGEVASGLATKVIRECARKILSGKESLPANPEADDSRPLRSRQLEHMIQKANRTIYEKGQGASKDHGMGTTVVAALIDDKKKMITVGHVGDSRLYLFRNGQLQALTQDHSLVMDQVRRGIITAEEAQNSTFQNILTRALGSEREVAIDIAEHPAVEGDVVLLCTDGLTKMIAEPEIAAILGGAENLSIACDRLIQAALDAGGVDNVTVVAARIGGKGPRGVRSFIKRMFRSE